MITAISPIDGRYHTKTKALSAYFSEFALFRYRLFVEIQYFIALCQHPLPELEQFDLDLVDSLNEIFEGFDVADAIDIKNFEKTTNHDVKAVEYFLKKKFKSLGIEIYQEFIHFGLTSQDVNNTALPLLLHAFFEEQYIPTFLQLLGTIEAAAEEWMDVPMLARTHGQPASPTVLGKELLVFHERLRVQFDQLRAIPFTAKFGGATGNFNAHVVAYPDIDWPAFSDNFVQEYLGLQRSRLTTQIDHYDNLAAIFHACQRINTILIDLCRDIWTYISMDYFKQRIVAGEVGSSTMPHKVNPIDFENAEGNLGLANAIFSFLAQKMPVSRLQRDLTDSTVSRNVGVPFGHTVIAIQSLLKGMSKLLLNQEKIRRDLDANWSVVAEAIQSVLRKIGYPEPYEVLKDFTRGKAQINQKDILEFIDSLEIEKELKENLKQITPHNYVGILDR